ncbi:MAG: DUF4270 domain-containing protein [Bacteroidota bacterium]|nr:DUF4270 domain-containing protein [Bacteroidota bacterium]
MINTKKWRLPALLLAGGMTFAACSEPDSLGIEVQPKGDQPGVFFTDTVTIHATTIREDSLRSDEAVAAFNLAGSYTDPVFGMSKASFYSQLRLPNNNTNFTFGNTPVLDSVVLTMAYADYYGDTLMPLFMEVLQLSEQLVFDSTYYTNDVLTTGATLYSGTIEAHPKDSVLVNGTLRAPHLRLRLPDAIGNDFLNAGNAIFADNSTFTNFFKGIHVRTNVVNGGGLILSFNLKASMSKLTVYYRNAGNPTTISANFEINSECPRFNNYEHDYTTAIFGAVFPVSGNDKLYIQSMAGLKVRFSFPYIKNFASNGAVSINKAELVIPVLDNAAPYTNHQALLTFGVNDKGAEAIIPDILESSSYYGGAFSTITSDYKFNIGRYVQRLISGKIATDYGLSLVSSGGAVNAFRTIIPGTTGSGNKIKLRLTYSKLD